MWIDNYDDPEEMVIATALKLLSLNGYRNHTDEANKQNKTDTYAVFVHPSGEGMYYCDDDNEIIDLAIGEALTFPGE